MSTLKDRMAEAMRRHPHLSQADIARACKVRSPSVTDWLNGKTKSLKSGPAMRAGQLFGCDQNWIGLGIGLPNWPDQKTTTPASNLSHLAATLPPTTREDAMRKLPPADGYVRLPMMGEAAAGDGREALELVEHVDVAEDWVRRTLRTNPATLRVLTARGHSMTGQIEDGDVMFVVPASTFDDDGVYIIAVDGLLRVKRLRLRVLDKLLSIESNDGRAAETIPLSQVDGSLRICGRVLGAWSLRRM